MGTKAHDYHWPICYYKIDFILFYLSKTNKDGAFQASWEGDEEEDYGEKSREVQMV